MRLTKVTAFMLCALSYSVIAEGSKTSIYAYASVDCSTGNYTAVIGDPQNTLMLGIMYNASQSADAVMVFSGWQYTRALTVDCSGCGFVYDYFESHHQVDLDNSSINDQVTNEIMEICLTTPGGGGGTEMYSCGIHEVAGCSEESD
jgi:hypothetical protein